MNWSTSAEVLATSSSLVVAAEDRWNAAGRWLRTLRLHRDAAGGVLTLLDTRVWARRIEAEHAIFRPKPKPGP